LNVRDFLLALKFRWFFMFNYLDFFVKV
jgi:hypothetical protein